MRVSRGILESAGGNVTAPLAALLSAPILAQVLGVEGRGQVAVATAPVLLAISALTLGLPEAMTYFVSRRPQDALRLLWRAALLAVPLALAGTLALVAGSTQLAPTSELAALLALCSTALAPGLLLGVLRGVAAGQNRWRLIAGERSAAAVVRLIWIVTLWQTESLTVSSAAVSIAATSTIGLLVYIPMAATAARTPGAPCASTKPEESAGLSTPGMNTRGIASFGSRLWLGSLAGILLARLDQTLMIPLSTTSQIGLYAVAVSVSETVLVFNSAVRDVIFAVESRSEQPGRLATAARLSTVITAALAAGMAVLAVLFMEEIFGPGFEAAVPITCLLLLGIVLGNAGSVAGVGLSARGRPGLRSLSLVVAAAVNVALVLLLVPPYGALGAGAATVVGNIVAAAANIFWLRLRFGLRPLDFFGLRRSDLCLVARLLPERVRRRSRGG